jgi:hypothetical protein
VFAGAKIEFIFELAKLYWGFFCVKIRNNATPKTSK